MFVYMNNGNIVGIKNTNLLRQLEVVYLLSFIRMDVVKVS